MQAIRQRMLTAENRQQRMMSFFAKAVQNPSFLSQLMQQSENKRLAASVRKKRRLPKEDSMSADNSASSGDTSADNQMVAFQPNGKTESNGARGMMMQFFNSTDTSSSPRLDASGPLDAMMRDLGSAPSGADVSNPHNRQSSVTLTEMNMPGLENENDLPGPTLMFTCPNQVDLHMPPYPAARMSRIEGTWRYPLTSIPSAINAVRMLLVGYPVSQCGTSILGVVLLESSSQHVNSVLIHRSVTRGR